MTVDSFVPPDQPQKLQLIAQAAKTLDPVFAQSPRPAPTPAESASALENGVDMINQTIGGQSGPGADAAKRLADDMTQLAKADPAMRTRCRRRSSRRSRSPLTDSKNRSGRSRSRSTTLPSDLADQWLKADGRARVEVYPKGDPNDNEVLRQFARAVQAVEPNATGGPISILESRPYRHSRVHRGRGWAFLSIAVLLWIILRRFGDVLLTLIPLLLAGVLTLELCVVIGMPLNFANIIALPLLLGVGVAFKIYYIMAWRAGQTGLLQSSLTRAVTFSAMTTATAFGSLALEAIRERRAWKAAGPVARLHAGGGGAVPARPDGPTAPGREGLSGYGQPARP